MAYIKHEDLNRVEDSSENITSFLQQVTKGDQSARDKLIPLVYGELHRIAANYMRGERQGHTLQATALVHETYLKLVKQRRTNWRNRAHFFGIAAQLMRRILIDHARGNLRTKRGGGQEKISLDEALLCSEDRSEDLLVIDEALTRLEKSDQTQSRIVELRFFGGMTVREIAEYLHMDEDIVEREWSFAKAWLYSELKARHGNTARKTSRS